MRVPCSRTSIRGAASAPALALLATVFSCPELTVREPTTTPACTMAEDCARIGLMHPECVGEWVCRHDILADGAIAAGQCAWDCHAENACRQDADCASNQICHDGACVCTPIDCLADCANGYVLDENGCNTCTCKEPPPPELICHSDTDCKEGQRCTAGHEECLSSCDPGTGIACNTVCAGHCIDATCDALVCPDLVWCEFGRAKDERGCLTCECAPPPTCEVCEGPVPPDGCHYDGCQLTAAGECVPNMICDECSTIRFTCEGQTPVCGADGKTYDCALAAKCFGHTTVAHEGACDCTIECFVYDPVCTEKGTLSCGHAEAACKGLTVLYEGECQPPPTECCFDTILMQCVDACVTADGGRIMNCSCSADMCTHCAPEPKPCDQRASTTCASDTRCVWLTPGCSDPALPKEGCYPAADCSLADVACPTDTTCQTVTVNPCTGAGLICDACAAERGVCLPPPPPPECLCPDVWAPVCGADLKTYGNECEARCAGATIRHAGECGQSCCPACLSILPQCPADQKCDALDNSGSTGECVPLNYCDISDECAGLPHDRCLGKWACERHTCIWYCAR